MPPSPIGAGHEPAPSPPAGRGGLALALAMVAGAFFVAGYQLPPILAGGPPDARAVGPVLPQPVPVPAFALRDHDGRAFTRERLIGKWTLVVFGYTHCPGHCAAALDAVTGVLDDAPRLGTSPGPLQAVFVSVDPPRDTPARLRAYLARFDARFVGLSGDARTTARLAQALGVAYERRTRGPGGDYLVDHTRAVLLVGPEARLLAGFPLPLDAGSLTAGLEAAARRRGADA